MAKKSPLVYILNGPNLNLLGIREPKVYGTWTLKDIESAAIEVAKAVGLVLDFRQSNSEGELIDWVQEACHKKAGGIIINPAAYSHTSIGLMDAIKASGLPTIEVHISNVHQREKFRHHSYISSVARGVLCGLGPQGYLLALEAMADILNVGAKIPQDN